MKLLFLLFLYIFQLSDTFASPTNEFILGDVEETAVPMVTSIQSDENGYECGDIFFYDREVEMVLSAGLNSLDKQLDVQEYHGPLYADSEISQYFLSPIKKGKIIFPTTIYNRGSYFIVFKSDKREVIDVIARITNNHYTKCIRKDKSRAEQLTSISENTNGYQCSHDFISDHIIQKSTLLAKEKIGGHTNFPTPYIGRLFPQNGEYLVWPIFERNKLCTSGNEKGGPYFLVINKKGEFIDVVVTGFSNILRCPRSKEFQAAPKHDPYTKLFAPAPRHGFQCSKAFFDIKALDIAALVAKTVTFHRAYPRFPIEYNGSPFSEPCLFWPIFSDGRLYRKGRPGPYRVVMSLDYKVIATIIVDKNNRMSLCERTVMKGKKNHDPSDYFCDGHHFTNQKIVDAAEEGCDRLNLGSRGNKLAYPAEYKGPKFEKEGPYIFYPLHENGDRRSKRTKSGRYRVVMNYTCEVVGAVYVPKANGKVGLRKCEKIPTERNV